VARSSEAKAGITVLHLPGGDFLYLSHVVWKECKELLVRRAGCSALKLVGALARVVC
jgi:hypothetical protein